MLADVLVHFGLEAVGAAGLRCVGGICHHAAHRAAAWTAVGLLTSAVTVTAVG